MATLWAGYIEATTWPKVISNPSNTVDGTGWEKGYMVTTDGESKT